ncbi:MAG TPA: hypothetical protein VIM84_09945, partial [Gemmatimonadales bacterium]
PGTISEIALALKAGKPVILLGASAPARELFAELGPTRKVLHASRPDEVMRLIEERLKIPRTSWDR